MHRNFGVNCYLGIVLVSRTWKGAMGLILRCDHVALWGVGEFVVALCYSYSVWWQIATPHGVKLLLRTVANGVL